MPEAGAAAPFPERLKAAWLPNLVGRARAGNRRQPPLSAVKLGIGSPASGWRPLSGRPVRMAGGSTGLRRTMRAALTTRPATRRQPDGAARVEPCSRK